MTNKSESESKSSIGTWIDVIALIMCLLIGGFTFYFIYKIYKDNTSSPLVPSTPSTPSTPYNIDSINDIDVDDNEKLVSYDYEFDTTDYINKVSTNIQIIEYDESYLQQLIDDEEFCNMYHQSLIKAHTKNIKDLNTILSTDGMFQDYNNHIKDSIKNLIEHTTKFIKTLSTNNTSQLRLKKVRSILNKYIGRSDIKKQIIKDIVLMKESPTTFFNINRNFIFKGSTGNGKTYSTSILANCYNVLGIYLNQFKQISKANLTSSYVASSTPMTIESLSTIIGGIGFIDEAYTISSGNELNITSNSHDNEITNTLLPLLEVFEGKLVFILAGYKDKMDKYLSTNEGLNGRFIRQFNLDEYSMSEYTFIFINKCRSKDINIPSTIYNELYTLLSTLEYKGLGSRTLTTNLFNILYDIIHSNSKPSWNDSDEAKIVLLKYSIELLKDSEVYKTSNRIK